MRWLQVQQEFVWVAKSLVQKIPRLVFVNCMKLSTVHEVSVWNCGWMLQAPEKGL